MNNPGVKTSEFWVIAVTMVLGAINELTGRQVDTMAAAAVWGPAIAYALARAIAKFGQKPAKKG